MTTLAPTSAQAPAGPTGFIEKTPLERYVPPARPSLVGLARSGLIEALAGIGVPEVKRKMRAQQIWSWLYLRGATRFDQMTSLSKDLRVLLEEHLTLARPEVVSEQISVDGTRKWLLRLPGEGAAASARGRMRLYPGYRSRHALSVEPGRLHAQLLVLPYRNSAPGAQPDGRRDRRPGPGRARPPRRLVGGHRGCRPPPRHQCGHDGDGRAALQFRGGA